MPTSDRKGQATREAIIAAAEEQFADHGLDGTSLRRIMAAAGTNPASIHYHFGSKEELVRGILAHRMPGIERRRRELVAELVEPEPSARSVLEALIRPHAELAVQTEGRAYIGFLAAITFASDSDLAGFVNDDLAPLGRELVTRLGEICSDIPGDLVLRRVRLALDLALRALSRPEHFAEAGRALDFDELVDFLVAGLTAPVPHAAAPPVGRQAGVAP